MGESVRRGQAMLEYVLVMAGLLVLGTILWSLVNVSIRHAERTENLVSSEYP